jgi:hypothetical protein
MKTLFPILIAVLTLASCAQPDEPAALLTTTATTSADYTTKKPLDFVYEYAIVVDSLVYDTIAAEHDTVIIDITKEIYGHHYVTLSAAIDTAFRVSGSGTSGLDILIEAYNGATWVDIGTTTAIYDVSDLASYPGAAFLYYGMLTQAAGVTGSPYVKYRIRVNTANASKHENVALKFTATPW